MRKKVMGKGAAILDFVVAHDLALVNTYFQKMNQS
uniref:Uncharacterized protein n=1 Tax=Rhizophora mucronata TaxID=61149 RepID=A0A2P2NU19_RHIMU